ncbi:MAG: S8 family serine peptidase [Iphinoe sp. HA4291-MV1]|jgi:subtilisin family serine protease|nr:S8 family serine peptidase [Iphinoe sp. HA4291-MV1]
MTEQQRLDDNQLYYYADDKKISLMPSRQFITVRADAQRNISSMGVNQIVESLSAVTTPAQVFQLPQYNLAVVKVAPGSGFAATSTPVAETIRSFVNSQPELTLGPSVYEVPEASTQEGLIPIGEILVKFKPNVSESQKKQLLGENNLEVQRSDYPEPGAYLLACENGSQTVAIANKLHESDLVEYAQPNFVRLTPRLNTPNGAQVLSPELSFNSNSSLKTTAATPSPSASVSDPGFTSQWGLKKILAPEAWDISMGSPDIAIAVLDEGCDLNHEDISYKLPGYDATSGSDNPSPLPRDGHGTSCAGIVAAKANNGLGGAGVAPNCKILPVRIAYGAGGGWVTTDAQIADGVRTAVNRGADVLSNSWGGGAPSSAITSAFQYAQTNGRGGKGCPIAIATGNEDVRGVSYPANLSPTIPGLMAVGASNEWDQRKNRTSLDGESWWGSNYGPEVDVVAPGVHIYTTDIMGAAGYGGGNYIPNFNGTSSATPHVAGLMGLILSVDPNLRSWEVEEIIKRSADDFGPAGRDEEFGFGRINCRRALEMLSPISFNINVTPEFIGAGRECFMRINLRLFNPSINSVRLDSLNVTSHNDDWTAEIDRFEYRPNPGGIMEPFTGQDVLFNGILLKANGTESGWSYRWSLSWTYTFWRPNAPGVPLSANTALAESAGTKVTAKSAKGGATMPQSDSLRKNATAMIHTNGANGVLDDSIVVERQSRTITIVIR